MSSPIADKFCLKAGRRNFHINVRESSEDRQVYFGKNKLNDELVRKIRQQYAMGMPPKLYIWGLYGAGKTHTLNNLKYQLEESSAPPQESYNVRVRIIQCEFRKKTDFRYLHGQILETIGVVDARDVLRRYIAQNATQDVAALLQDRFGDSNVARAVHSLALGAQDVTLWKWLCGGVLSPGELTALGLTKNISTAAEMVTSLVGICHLFQDESVNYLFMFDEFEGASNVEDRDAQESFHDAFRKLASDENTSVGYILSAQAGDEQNIPEFIFRADIKNRIGRNNIHNLVYMQEAYQVETFLKDLLTLVIDRDKVSAKEESGDLSSIREWYPFTDIAKEQFVDLAVSAPSASLPRNVIKAVNECAVEALNRNANMIDSVDLEPARQIFQEEY